MRSRRSLGASAAAALALATVAAPVAAAPPQAGPPAHAASQGFEWSEATLDEARMALVTGRLTCRELVEGYLDRIEAYDQQGPALTSIVEVNPDALAEADALDAQGQVSRGASTGALHCVPVLVKDNIDVEGLPTTAGSTALAGTMPPDDAHIIERMRDEGAIVLAKANMDKFAFGFGGSSTVIGQTRNAYEPSFGPGGSSSGTGAGVAASFGLLGIGTDTGGSIRVPSTVHGLVGIRPSMRLLSQDGIVPLALFQDTAGPMCRAVADCASFLEVLAGFDGGETSGQYTLTQQRDDLGILIDAEEAFWDIVGVAPDAYTTSLDADGLDGARIGVVRALFGNDPDVQATVDAAIEQMDAAGATIEDVTIPELSTVTGFTSMSGYEFYDHLTGYLSSWEGDHPQSFEEVQARINERTGTFVSRAALGANRYDNATYNRNTLDRPGIVQPRLLAALDNTDLDGVSQGEPFDALLYPSVVSLPRPGSPAAGTNNRLSAYSGFPALTMPAGFTEATEDRPALPVGMELLGREFDEPTLLGIAYAYEQTVVGTPLARQAPTTAPELEGAAPSGPGRSGAAPGRSGDAPGRSGAATGRR